MAFCVLPVGSPASASLVCRCRRTSQAGVASSGAPPGPSWWNGEPASHLERTKHNQKNRVGDWSGSADRFFVPMFDLRTSFALVVLTQEEKISPLCCLDRHHTASRQRREPDPRPESAKNQFFTERRLEQQIPQACWFVRARGPVSAWI